MINRIIIIVFLLVILNNCGKKADPEYKAIYDCCEKKIII